MQTHYLAAAFCGLLVGFGLSPANAGVEDRVSKECGECHQMTGTSDSLQHRAERKAPPLSYAGDKFQEA